MNYRELGAVATIDRVLATDEECARLPYVGLDDIEKGTGRFTDLHTTEPEELLATKFRFTPNHVLYGKLRPNLNKVALPTFDGVCTTEIVPLLPHPDLLDRWYLWGLLLHPEFVRWATNIVTGANLPRLPPTDLATYRIPVPPIAEQQRIAAILRAADEERRRRRYTQTLSDGLLGEVFTQLFGDPATNPLGWEVKPLHRLCSAIIDCPHSTPIYAEGKTPYACVRSSDIQGGYLDFSAVQFLEADDYKVRTERGTTQQADIIYCREGARLGNAARVIDTDQMLALGQRMMLYRVNPQLAMPEFIWTVLDSKSTKQTVWDLVGGSASPHVNIRDLASIDITVPPLEHQQRYSCIVRQHDSVRRQQQESARQSEQLFAALLQRAFAGEL